MRNVKLWCPEATVKVIGRDTWRSISTSMMQGGLARSVPNRKTTAPFGPGNRIRITVQRSIPAPRRCRPQLFPRVSLFAVGAEAGRLAMDSLSCRQGTEPHEPGEVLQPVPRGSLDCQNSQTRICCGRGCRSRRRPAQSGALHLWGLEGDPKEPNRAERSQHRRIHTAMKLLPDQVKSIRKPVDERLLTSVCRNVNLN